MAPGQREPGILNREAAEELLAGSLQHDRKRQLAVIKRFYADDVRFQHPFFVVKGRNTVYEVFRNYQTFCSTEYVVRDFVEAPGRSVLWVEQRVTHRLMPWTYFVPLVFSTICFMTIVKCPETGRPLIVEQVDDYAASGFPGSLGALGVFWYDGIFKPFWAWVLPSFGRLFDRVQEQLDCYTARFTHGVDMVADNVQQAATELLDRSQLEVPPPE